MQAHSRWLHAIRKCVITEKKCGVKKLRITRLRKYPIDPKAYLGHCSLTYFMARSNLIPNAFIWE